MVHNVGQLSTLMPHIHKLVVANMRMCRFMHSLTRKDRIENEVIRDKLGVACTEDKLQDAGHLWFGHVRRRHPNVPVRRKINLEQL